MKFFTLFLAVLFLISAPFAEAKKIRSSFKIEKARKSEKKEDLFIGKEMSVQESMGSEGQLPDSLCLLKLITFAGYEKEPGSSLESFILINSSDQTVTAFKVRIDYMDMKNRMLHSRIVSEPCNVPPSESRRFDIKSWDTQHTYYYHLGNAPKRIATPYKVSFTPVSFWIEN